MNIHLPNTNIRSVFMVLSRQHYNIIFECDVALQANATPICPTLPVLNPEHGPHMYNFLFLNIRRLLLKSGTDKTKIDFMKDLSNSYTLFICLCETFLNSSILNRLNAEIFMPGFVVYRCDRAD